MITKYLQVAISKLYHSLPQTSLSAASVSLLVHISSHDTDICFFKHWWASLEIISVKQYSLWLPLSHYYNELYIQKCYSFTINKNLHVKIWSGVSFEFLHFRHAGHALHVRSHNIVKRVPILRQNNCFLETFYIKRYNRIVLFLDS